MTYNTNMPAILTKLAGKPISKYFLQCLPENQLDLPEYYLFLPENGHLKYSGVPPPPPPPTLRLVRLYAWYYYGWTRLPSDV